MTTNQGFLAQASDLPLSKGQWTASTLGGSGAATPWTLAAGPSNGAGTTGAPAVTMGGVGLLVPSGVFLSVASQLGGGAPLVPQTPLNPTNPTGQIQPSVGITISKIAAQFTTTAIVADDTRTVVFTLFCQRNNSSGVPQAPVSTGISTPATACALASGVATLTQVFADFSGLNSNGLLETQAWQVQAGDVYFVQASFSALLSTAAGITNTIVTIG